MKAYKPSLVNIFSFFSCAFLILALIYPWYSISGSNTETIYSLRGKCIRFKVGDTDTYSQDCTAWDDLQHGEVRAISLVIYFFSVLFSPSFLLNLYINIIDL